MTGCDLIYPCFGEPMITWCQYFTKLWQDVTWFIPASRSQGLPYVSLVQKCNRVWLDTSILLRARDNLISPWYKRRTGCALTYPCCRESRITRCHSCTQGWQDGTWYITASGSQGYPDVTLVHKDNRMWLDKSLLQKTKDFLMSLLYKRTTGFDLIHPCFMEPRITWSHPSKKGGKDVPWHMPASWSQG